MKIIARASHSHGETVLNMLKDAELSLRNRRAHTGKCRSKPHYFLQGDCLTIDQFKSRES